MHRPDAGAASAAFLFLALSGVAGVGCAEAPAGSAPGAPSASAPTAVPTSADASFALVEPSELVAAPVLAPLPPEPPQGGWALEVLEAALVQGDEGPITLRVTNASTSSTRIEDLALRFPSGYEVRDGAISLPPGWEVREVDDERIELRARRRSDAIDPGQEGTFVLEVEPPRSSSGRDVLDRFAAVDADPMRGGPWNPAPEWTRRALRAEATFSPELLDVGQTTTLTLSVTNRTRRTIDEVAPLLAALEGDASWAVVSGPTPASVDLARDARATFTWTLRAEGRGSSTASLVAGNGAATSPLVTTAPVAAGNEPPGGGWKVEVVDARVVQGAAGVLTFELTNAATSSSPIARLDLDLPSGYRILRALAQPPGWTVDDLDDATIELRAGSGAAVAPGGRGSFSLEVEAPRDWLGRDVADQLRDADVAPLQGGPWAGLPGWTRHALAATARFEPATVAVGGTTTLTLSVTNAAAFLGAWGVTPTAPALEGSAGWTVLAGPTPAEATVGYGATQTFSWTLRADARGETIARLQARSTLGSTPLVMAGPARVSDFVATAAVEPEEVIPGGEVTLSLLVANYTGENLAGVAPTAPTVDGQVTLLSGPVPPSADIVDGAAALFRWTYRVDGPVGSEATFTAAAVAPARRSADAQATARLVRVGASVVPTLVPAGAADVRLTFTVANGATRGRIDEVRIRDEADWQPASDPFQADTSGWRTRLSSGWGGRTYRFETRGRSQEIAPGAREQFTLELRRAPNPSSAVVSELEVEVRGDLSGEVVVRVLVSPAPTITDLVPRAARVNGVVTIVGAGFGLAVGDATVTFAGGAQGEVLTASPTRLTVRIPAGAESGPVEVSTAAGAAVSPFPLQILEDRPDGEVLPPTPVAGFVLAVASDGEATDRAYAVLAGAAPRVVVLDAERGVALREVPYGIAPQACAPARTRGRLFVSDSATDLLAELDLEAGTVLSERVTGPFPYGVALAAGDQRALVASVFGASVRVFDLAGGAAWDLGLGPDAMPQFGARTADGDVVFSHWWGGLLSRIDPAIPAVIDQLAAGGPHEEGLERLVVCDGRAFVTHYLTHEVRVVDLATRAVVATIATGLNPFGIALTPDGREAWVCCSSDGELTVIDTRTLEVRRRLFLDPAMFPWDIAIGRDGAALIGGADRVVKVD